MQGNILGSCESERLDVAHIFPERHISIFPILFVYLIPSLGTFCDALGKDFQILFKLFRDVTIALDVLPQAKVNPVSAKILRYVTLRYP